MMETQRVASYYSYIVMRELGTAFEALDPETEDGTKGPIQLDWHIKLISYRG